MKINKFSEYLQYRVKLLKKKKNHGKIMYGKTTKSCHFLKLSHLTLIVLAIWILLNIKWNFLLLSFVFM